MNKHEGKKESHDHEKVIWSLTDHAYKEQMDRLLEMISHEHDPEKYQAMLDELVRLFGTPRKNDCA